MTVLLATSAASRHLEFLSNLRYQTVGFSIVMVSLASLAIIVAIVAALLAPLHRAKALAAVEIPGEISPEVRAVIAAALHVVFQSPHRILDVQPANPQLQAWSMEGRRQIFQSHSVR